MKNISCLIALICALNIASYNLEAVVAPSPDNFSVFVSGNVSGNVNNTTGYGSDFQGIYGVGGNAFFTNFQGYSSNTPTPYSYTGYVGGNYTLSSGSNNGGIEVRGNVNLNSSSINNSSSTSTNNANVHGGGNLQGGGNGSSINGYTIAGSYNGGLTVTGQPQLTGVAFSPTVNLSNVASYFQSASSYYGGLSNNTTATVSQYTPQLQVTLTNPGLNIVSTVLLPGATSPTALTLGLFTSGAIAGFNISGPAGSWVVFDISGSGTGTINGLYTILNGINISNVLLNFTGNDTLNLTSGFSSILAPNSTITYTNGAVQGSLVAQNLYGNGEVDIANGQPGFTGYQYDQSNFVQAPEPVTYLTLASFLALAVLFRRKAEAKRNIA